MYKNLIFFFVRTNIFMLYEGTFCHRMPIYMHMPMSLLDFPTNTKPFNSEFTTKGDIWA